MSVSKTVFGVQVAFFFADGSNISILKIASAIQEVFKAMFPTDPQILPLPQDAPPEVPRCIFQKPDGSATLTVSLIRMDFNAGIKADASWKNFHEVVAYAFMKICRELNITVKRIGLIIQANAAQELDDEINNLVSKEDFAKSTEKSISWVNQENINNGLTVNIVNNIQINHNNIEMPNIITIDVNTHNDTPLKNDYKEMINIIDFLLSKIEGRLEDVI